MEKEKFVKMKYVTPEIQVTEFELCSFLATSAATIDPGAWSIDDGEDSASGED